MRRFLFLIALLTPAMAQQPFTLQQALSAPYATSLTAAPVGNQFAWVEDAEGRHNLWVASPTTTARQLTHNTEDDAQDIDALAWSPDATAIAYTYGAGSGADGKPANPAHLQRNTPLQVIVQPIAANATALIIGEGHAPLFTRDGKSVLFLRAGQIWIAPLPTTGNGKTCWLPEGCSAAAPSNSVHQFVFDRGSASSLTLSPDGHLLAFISTRRESGTPSHSFLALYNLTTHELSFPAPSTGNDSAPTFSPDGKQIAWLRAPFTRQPEYTPHISSANPWSIQLLDLATNTARTVYSPEPNKPGSVLPHIADSAPYLLWVAATPSRPQRLLFYSEADSWTHLYSLDPSHPASPTLLTPTEHFNEVSDVSVKADGTELLLSANGPDHACAVGLDAVARHLQTTCHADTPDLDDRLSVWHLNFSDGTWTSPESQSANIHPQFLADGEVVMLASDFSHPLHPEIGLKGLADVNQRIKNLYGKSIPSLTNAREPKLALFKAEDGTQLHAFVFTSDDEHSHGRHPAIIFVHGGPNRQMLLGYPGMDYYSNAYAMNQYLASRGFIVLSVNYRGGIGYGLNFREAANYGPDGASEYNDVLAAQKYLVSRADVDPARIGIWGGSYGGYLTALALARNSNLFAAGVDFHGVHEWSLEGNPERWMTDPTHATSAQKDAAAALAHASSPMADIDKWRSPVLLIHGDNDPEVAYAQTPTLADALRARNVPVEELIFPDEVHGFLLHKDWLAAYTAAAAFFERTLKP